MSAPDSQRWGRKERVAALLVFAAALIPRLLHLQQIRANDPYFTLPSVDPRLYHEWAVRISQGDWIGDGVFFLGPLYPYFLALIYRVTGPDFLVPRLVNVLLGAGTCVLVFALARRLFDLRVAVVAGAMTAVYGMLIFYGGTLMVVNITVPLVLLVLLAALRAGRLGTPASALLAGALIGLAALARQDALLFAPLLGGWLLWSGRAESRRPRIAQAAALLLGTALLVLPATLRNYLLEGDFVLINATSGMNLFIGNYPAADGTFRPPRIGGGLPVDNPIAMRDSFKRVAEEDLGRELLPSEVSAYWAGTAFRIVRARPLDWLRLEVRKLSYFVNAREVWNNRSLSVSRAFSWVLRLPLLGFGVVAPLAILGIALSASRWRTLMPLYLALALYVSTALVFFVLSRYRMPAVPVLIVFAACAVVMLFDAARARLFRDLALAGVLLVVFFAAVHLDLGRENLAMAHFNLGNKYRDLGRWDPAIHSYLESLAYERRSFSTWNNLALVYEARGGSEAQAIRAWQQILEMAQEREGEAYRARALEHLGALGALPSDQGSGDP